MLAVPSAWNTLHLEQPSPGTLQAGSLALRFQPNTPSSVRPSLTTPTNSPPPAPTAPPNHTTLLHFLPLKLSCLSACLWSQRSPVPSTNPGTEQVLRELKAQQPRVPPRVPGTPFGCAVLPQVLVPLCLSPLLLCSTGTQQTPFLKTTSLRHVEQTEVRSQEVLSKSQHSISTVTAQGYCEVFEREFGHRG